MHQSRLTARPASPIRAIKSCLGFLETKLRERQARPAVEVGFMSDEAERIFLANESARRY